MILGIYGFQDSGKTVLLEKLVAALVNNGYSVASIKHTPHDKTIDCEGKDTWRHWKAGSDPVVFSSKTETTIIHHSGTPPEQTAAMLSREFNPDVIIIEGCKSGRFPKIAVGKVDARGETLMVNPPLKRVVEYVEKELAVERVLARLPGLDCGKCGFDCRGFAFAVVADSRRVSDCRELSDTSVEVVLDGNQIPLGKFASKMADSTIRGMLSSLKGYEPGKDVEIRLSAKKADSKRRRRSK